jgi:hypothetical protein
MPTLEFQGSTSLLWLMPVYDSIVYKNNETIEYVIILYDMVHDMVAYMIVSQWRIRKYF